MNSVPELKVKWTWEEWRQSRAARRAVTARVGPRCVRRRASSADDKLRIAFDGQRGPAFSP